MGNIKWCRSSVNIVSMPDGKATLRAWKHSRPNDTTTTLADVIKVDTPVNEMESFVLEFFAPILFREMIFSLRDHVGWARTSRVDDLTEWPLNVHFSPFGFLLDNEHDFMLKSMGSATQDEFRLLLPMCYMTHFTVKLSARTLIRFNAGLWKLASGLEEEYPSWSRCLKDISGHISLAVDQSPYGRHQSGVYGAEDIFPEVSENDIFGSVHGASVIDNFMTIRMIGTMNLRAQMVRHRPIHIRDDMRRFLMDPTGRGNMKSEVYINAMMPLDVAKRIVSKRNCWIAQEDIWARFIALANEALSSSGDGFALPCDEGNCPFVRDNELRMDGKDPAPPCPLWAAKCGEPVSGEMRASMMGYMNRRPLSKERWQQIYIEKLPDLGA